MCNIHGLQQTAMETLTLNAYFSLFLSRTLQVIFAISFSFQEKKKEKFFQPLYVPRRCINEGIAAQTVK